MIIFRGPEVGAEEQGDVGGGVTERQRDKLLLVGLFRLSDSIMGDSFLLFPTSIGSGRDSIMGDSLLRCTTIDSGRNVGMGDEEGEEEGEEDDKVGKTNARVNLHSFRTCLIKDFFLPFV